MPRVKFVSPSDAIVSALRRLHVAEELNDDEETKAARLDLEVARIRLNLEFREHESQFAAGVDAYVKTTIARYVLPHYVDAVAALLAFDVVNHTDAQLRTPGFVKKWTKAWLANHPEVAIEFWRKVAEQPEEGANEGHTNEPTNEHAKEQTSSASPPEPPAAALATPELTPAVSPKNETAARAATTATDPESSARPRKNRAARGAARPRESRRPSHARSQGKA